MSKNYKMRLMEIDSLIKTRSLFLFGPRQTGKSTYLRFQLSTPILHSYNLLNQKTFTQLLNDPTLIRQHVIAQGWSDGLIIIDEIQKIPALLDEVHLLIEEFQLRFILTGSSARKLKSLGTNLLGGRARTRNLCPFTYKELGGDFDLQKAMKNGTIYMHYYSDLIDEDLGSYVGRYLNEEIAMEGVVRNLAGFSRFLEVASTCNAQLINYTSIASDCSVTRPTVQNYFQILVDTFLGIYLEAYTSTTKRKSLGMPKFYFFDMGIVRYLRGLEDVFPNTVEFGDFFEQFIICEVFAYKSYFQPKMKMHYWRSHSGYEVDLLINGTIAIEIKSSKQINSQKYFKGIKALAEDISLSKKIIVCFEDEARMKDDILILPWKTFLENLWDHSLYK